MTYFSALLQTHGLIVLLTLASHTFGGPEYITERRSAGLLPEIFVCGELMGFDSGNSTSVMDKLNAVVLTRTGEVFLEIKFNAHEEKEVSNFVGGLVSAKSQKNAGREGLFSLERVEHCSN